MVLIQLLLFLQIYQVHVPTAMTKVFLLKLIRDFINVFIHKCWRRPIGLDVCHLSRFCPNFPNTSYSLVQNQCYSLCQSWVSSFTDSPSHELIVIKFSFSGRSCLMKSNGIQPVSFQFLYC